MLLVMAIYLFIHPLPIFSAKHHIELSRLFGLVPIAAAFLLGHFWLIVHNLHTAIFSLEKKNEWILVQNRCCSHLNYKTIVQMMAGLLIMFSGIFLGLHFLKGDKMVEDKFELMFKSELTWNLKVRRLLNFFMSSILVTWR